jgi:hypothetical protein
MEVDGLEVLWVLVLAWTREGSVREHSAAAMPKPREEGMGRGSVLAHAKRERGEEGSGSRVARRAQGGVEVALASTGQDEHVCEQGVRYEEIEREGAWAGWLLGQLREKEKGSAQDEEYIFSFTQKNSERIDMI